MATVSRPTVEFEEIDEKMRYIPNCSCFKKSVISVNCRTPALAADTERPVGIDAFLDGLHPMGEISPIFLI